MSESIIPSLPANSAPVAPPASTSSHSFGGGFSISTEQAQSLASKLVAHGMDPERVNAALVADNITLPADTRSPAQVQHDAEWLGANHRDYAPEEYKILLDAEQRQTDTGRMAEAISMAGEFLSTLSLHPALGSGLMEHITATAKHVNSLSEIDRNFWLQGEDLALAQHFGSPEKLEAARAAVERALDVARSGGVKAKYLADTLAKSPALRSAFVVRTLAAHTGHMEAWRDSRPSR